MLRDALTPLVPHDPLSRRAFVRRSLSIAPSVSQWGCGEDGQLGLPSAPVTAKRATPDWHVPTPTALRLPSGESVAAHSVSNETGRREKPLVAGSRNSAARARSGATYAWGWNSHDTLGLDTDEEWIPTPRKVKFEKAFTSVSLGGWHAVALDGDGAAWALGGNEYGQAGVCGDARDERHAGVHVSEHVSVPARVAFSLQKNGEEQRDGRDDTRDDTPSRITQVACGGMNSFALENSQNDSRNDSHQDDDAKKENERASCRVFEWGARAGSEKEHARAPVAVPFHLPVAERVASLAAGMFHVLALTSHGRVFAWGKGDYGQLGLGRPGNWDAPKEVAPLSDKAVVFVAAGGWHSCALAADGACFTWGRGEYGRLGMAEDQADKQRPTEVAFEPDANEETKEKEKKKIVDAALGGSHTCFLDARGAVWSVGRNNHGRLGRVVHGKWTGAPGRVVFPPPRGGGEWVCESIVAGGRHTLAVARAV